MKRIALLVVVLTAACAALAGDSSGAASSYPSPLNLTSTHSSVSGSWLLGSTVGTSDSSTATVSVDNAADDGWYTFAPGVSTSTPQATIPTSPDGTGFVVAPAGGASGFPAGNWTFTAETFIPGATLDPGVAVLAVGMWKGTISGGAFTPTATILAPADDPGGHDLRSNFLATASATYALPKFALGAGETLYVEFWRHQVDGISDPVAADRELDLVVNDGGSLITHPAADDTPPSHVFGMTNLTGASIFDPATSTVYYDGALDGSFTLSDALADGGSGPLKVTYPGVATAGWTHPAETVSSGPDFTSSAYSWTAGSTTSPGAQAVVGEDNAFQTSTANLTITNDTTGPTGESAAISGGPDFSGLSVPLTLGNGADAGVGVDPNSGIVERATGTPDNGTCSSFGSFAAIPVAANADTSVEGGGCYRYRYTVSDLLGNSSTSPDSADAIVDTTPPTVTATEPTVVAGEGDQYWSSTTNTLWFRPAGSGSFTLNATAADAESGIAQVAFPDVSGTTGWSGSNGGTDTDAEFSSPTTYTWTTGASAPGAKTITASNGSGLTGTGPVTFTSDSTAPTGQTVALSSGPWFTSASVPLTIATGTDGTGSGIDSSRTVVQRASAPLTNGACGTYGSFAAVTLSGGADTSVTTGNCYHYGAQATDNVGNVSTLSAASADAKVDTTPPATPSLLFSGLSSASATGSTVYYNPATTAGSFTVTAASSDPESGVASYSFPTIAGFTAIGTGPSRTYTFAANPAAPVAPLAVTATNGSSQTSSTTFTLVPDSTPPTLTVLCNGKPCLATPYQKAVAVTISATDGTGSGIDAIRYTTDGTAPTVDGGTEYTGALTFRDPMRLRAQSYDKTGNASTPVSLTINSLADRLTFAAPLRVTVKAKARFLQARVSTSKAATVVATMRGTGLKTAQRWRFTLESGASIVQLRLPKAAKRPRTYRVTWVVTAGTTKAQKTSTVTLR